MILHFFRHRSSITCISMFIMFYVFVKIYKCGCNKCMIWVWLGIFENVKWWMWIVVKWNGIFESDGYVKMYFISFLIGEGLLWESVTLCLPIPLVPVMYPWVWVVTKLVSEHWLNSCIISCKCLFSLLLRWLGSIMSSISLRYLEILRYH